MFRAQRFPLATEFYLGKHDPRDPLASPLYADLRGLPPLFIHAGLDETLLDDSTRLAERAREAGVEVSLELWPVVPHVWQASLFSLVYSGGPGVAEDGGGVSAWECGGGRDWCPGWDLNPHSPCGKTDFKSVASADFATRALPHYRCSIPGSRVTMNL